MTYFNEFDEVTKFLSIDSIIGALNFFENDDYSDALERMEDFDLEDFDTDDED